MRRNTRCRRLWAMRRLHRHRLGIPSIHVGLFRVLEKV
jgi:hypothetical protein